MPARMPQVSQWVSALVVTLWSGQKALPTVSIEDGRAKACRAVPRGTAPPVVRVLAPPNVGKSAACVAMRRCCCLQRG